MRLYSHTYTIYDTCIHLPRIYIYIYIYIYICIYTNPSAQAGYDTRSILKRILTGLNSEFSLS